MGVIGGLRVSHESYEDERLNVCNCGLSGALRETSALCNWSEFTTHSLSFVAKQNLFKVDLKIHHYLHITIDNGKNGTILNFAQLAEGFSNYFKWQWHFWPPWGTEPSLRWEPFDSRMKALLWVSSESWCQVVRRVMMMFWRFKNMAILPELGWRGREEKLFEQGPKQFRDTSLIH